MKFETREQKAYIPNGLKKPNGVPMQKVTARLKVLNSYLKRFTKPVNTSFSPGKMIDVVIGMIPNSWCKIMAQSKTEPLTRTTRAGVIRNPRLDSPLAPKLEIIAAITTIQVVTSASSSRARILLRGNPTTQRISSLRNISKVKWQVIISQNLITTIKIRVTTKKLS